MEEVPAILKSLYERQVQLNLVLDNAHALFVSQVLGNIRKYLAERGKEIRDVMWKRQQGHEEGRECKKEEDGDKAVAKEGDVEGNEEGSGKGREKAKDFNVDDLKGMLSKIAGNTFCPQVGLFGLDLALRQSLKKKTGGSQASGSKRKTGMKGDSTTKRRRVAATQVSIH